MEARKAVGSRRRPPAHALAMTLDHHRVESNVARDPRVKLPKERKPHVPPPLAEHVERAAETLPRHHILPLLIVDECGRG